MVTPYYRSQNNDFLLANGDSFLLLPGFDFKFDMIFADPPYFLSNGGISMQSGKISVLCWLILVLISLGISVLLSRIEIVVGYIIAGLTGPTSSRYK